MDSGVRLFVVFSTIAGLTVANPLFNPDSNHHEKTLELAEHSKYTFTKQENENASRQPDRHLFTLLILDESKQLISRHENLRAFKRAPNNISYSFVKDDNVYFVSVPGDPPVRASQGTNMRHGTFDWMYTEEIFERGNNYAIWFSPSNRHLAYASRQSNVSREVLLTTYDRGEQYNYNYNMEYPKTGVEKIAEYTVSIYNVVRNKSITMEVHLRDSHSFHYLFAVSWVVLHGKELLMTTWANRWQNETSITLCSYETAVCSLIHEHKYEPKQWATPDDYVNEETEMVHSNSSLFVILPESRDDNAWQHIAKIQITTDFHFKSISFLPAGEYDVTRIKQYRPDDETIVYEARAPHPWDKNDYVSPTVEHSAIERERCISCEDSLSHNETQYHSEIEQRDNSLRVCKVENFTLHNGYEAIVQICQGNEELASIPVFLEVYGGPNFNQVKSTRMSDAGPLASVYIDVRGSGGRGWKYRSPVYGRLVTVEVEDTIEALQMVLDKYPRLDRSRIGVMGWSYGGTMTLALVEKAPPGFFKCALAGAPVTNFMYYDAAYTERYMGDAPPSNYTDLTSDVSAFSNTTLMLVHGMRDDNVHFQNSALMIEALENADISFQVMVYPNKDHVSALMNMHCIKLKNKFFSDCFA